MTKISIANDFSRFPAGRYKTDGPYSGEEFREKHLRPAFSREGKVTVDLDGARGYGSSFLEEAFGGLVRSGISVSDVSKKLDLVSKDSTLVEEIKDYIANARCKRSS